MTILEFLRYLKSEHTVSFYSEKGFLFNTNTRSIRNLPESFLRDAEITEISFSDKAGLRINVKLEEHREPEQAIQTSVFPERPERPKRPEYWQPCKIKEPFDSTGQKERLIGNNFWDI